MRPATARPEDPVAFERGAVVRRAEFEARVDELAGRIAAAGAGRWLVVSERGLETAVALLALARAGGVAVLPPNRQPETLRRLGAGTRGALPRDAPARGRPLEARAPDREAPWVELYTSGTTGEPRRHLKRVRHLEDEVATLEAVFGSAVPAGAPVFASVPPHHIYGLLFRALWPLAAGRPFHSESLLHVQEILARMARVEACALVSTPVHLRHMAAGGGLRALRGRCRAVFSSAGPLDADTAKAVAECLGVSPFEILGSTETGGVALRQRSVHGESWRPLPGVRIERGEDGTLIVSSPFASEGEPAGGGASRFRMGDRVELEHGGGFRLLGRADREVKIAGLRLSLPAMERALEQHAWVAEAVLLARERGGETRVAAALVPSAAGRAALARHGRRAVGAALAEHLAADFDPVLRPRSWRYVDGLPRNAQGKVPRAAVEALFRAGPADGAERGLRAGPAARRRERWLRVPADLPALEGHFEGHPVVPGVAQLGWVMEEAAALLGSDPRVRGFEALKFPTPLRPGDAALLRVELEGPVLRFWLGEGERVFASGRCVVDAGGGETP